MDFSRDIEAVGKEIKELFKSSAFTARIAALNAEKNDGVTVGEFRSRKYGWSDTEAETPALYVLGLREELISDEGMGKWVWFRYALEVYASLDDPEKLELLSNRYARLIDETLSSTYRDDGVVMGVEYSPTFKFEDGLFKTCSVQFRLKVLKDVT
jgi:hypothetical protein